jgi:hypothetical protein
VNARVNEMAAGIAPEIREPKWFADDGGTRRVPVLDESFTPARVIRHVGWRACMKCKRFYFSRDCARVRLCDPCKGILKSHEARRS